MKLLLLGSFDAGALENFYLKGLKQAGIDCTAFDTTADYYAALQQSVINKVINKISPAFFFERINKKLLTFIDNKKFDVILISKGLTLYASTIEALKSHATIVCCYNPDHPFKFFSPGSGNKNILNSINKYDLYFTYADSIRQQLKKDWKVESYTIPFGYDDSSCSKTVVNDISFKNKFLFIGAYDKDRVHWLSKVKGDTLQIYGNSKWIKGNWTNDFIKKCYQGRSIYNEEYKTAVATATGVLNLLRKQNIEEDSHNMRTFEVPGYGGVLISNRTSEQQAFFEDNKEAIYFDTVEELNDKLKYLQENPSEVEKIKKAARVRSVASKYSYTHRSYELYNILKKHL